MGQVIRELEDGLSGGLRGIAEDWDAGGTGGFGEFAVEGGER